MFCPIIIINFNTIFVLRQFGKVLYYLYNKSEPILKPTFY